MKQHKTNSDISKKVFLNKKVFTDRLPKVHSQYSRSSRLSEVMQAGFVYTSHFLNWFADGFENIYHLEIIHTVCTRANR